MLPDLLKDYAISEQPGVVASCGSINAVAPGVDGIRDSLLHTNERAQI